MCRASDIRVLVGQAGARGAEVVLQPLLQAAQDYFGIEPKDDPDVVRQKIAGRALLGDDAAREDLPLLFDFFGVRDPRYPAHVSDPIARQRQIVATIERYLHRDDGDRTTVTVVEDLHWADEASVEFLERWVDAIAGTRFLLLVNFRPGFQPTWMDSPIYQQIVLGPLGDDESERLARALIGPDPSVAELARAAAVRSGGNAFFLEEIIQTLVDSGQLRGERGNFAAPSRSTSCPFPTRFAPQSRPASTASTPKRNACSRLRRPSMTIAIRKHCARWCERTRPLC
jgi:adenylate cyclase